LNADTPSAPLLAVRDLRVTFPGRAGILRRETEGIRAVDGVDFEIAPGQSLGLAGETGSGKSAVGRAVLNLTAEGGRATGSVRFDGREILNLPEDDFRPLRKEMQIVYPDPYGSLNPRLRVAEILGKGYDTPGADFGERERLDRTVGLLESVGLSGDMLWRFPFEFSGGQRQRLAIARALATRPRLLVCDDPVGALDSSARAPVLDLLRNLRAELGLAFLFLAPDPAQAEGLCDRIIVLSRGKALESIPGPGRPAGPPAASARKPPSTEPALP